MLCIGKAGDHDDRDVPCGGLLLQLFQQGEAVHPGHHHIQQDQREALFQDAAQPLFRRLGDRDVVFIIQDRSQPGGLGGAVINDQYLFHIYISLFYIEPMFAGPALLLRGAEKMI